MGTWNKQTCQTFPKPRIQIPIVNPKKKIHKPSVFPSPLFDPIFRISEKWHLDFLKSRRFRTLSFKATHYCKFLSWSLLARLCRLGVIRSVVRRGSRQMTLLKVRRRVGRESCKKVVDGEEAFSAGCPTSPATTNQEADRKL